MTRLHYFLGVVSLESASTGTRFEAYFLALVIRQSVVDAYFSIQMIPPSTVICAFSGMLGNGGLMIFSTVPGRMVLVFSSMVSLCTNRFVNHFCNPICFSQIGFGSLVATSTANRVAVLRTLPAIVISDSVIGACCSASPSRRVLTLWS